MTTFEQYFIDDKAPKEEFCKKILQDFGINEEFSHIINGHVPVKASESPVKANGKLLVIDRRLCKRI